MDNEIFFDLNLEQTVLGAMINNEDSLNSGMLELRVSDFKDPKHIAIFEELNIFYTEDRKPHLDIFLIQLESKKKLEACGGQAYVFETCALAGLTVDISQHCHLLQEKTKRRSLYRLGERLHAMAGSEGSDPNQLAEKAIDQLFAILEANEESNTKTGTQIFNAEHRDSKKSYIEEIEERQARHRENPDQPFHQGISFGFNEMDDILGGLRESNFVVLGARPSMGKSALGLKIFSNVILESKKTAVVFSLEMTIDEVVQRIICSTASIDIKRFERGSIEGAEFQRAFEKIKALTSDSMIIDDTSNISIFDLRNKAKKLKKVYDVDLIIIDHLHLITLPSHVHRANNKVEEMNYITKAIKQLARELKIPILVLAQLNRNVEGREDKVPVLADLRDSGTIEQDADSVMFLCREDYYDNENKWGHDVPAAVVVRKNRHGELGQVDLKFNKPSANFYDFKALVERINSGGEN